MSDPTELLEALSTAEDAFSHAHGQPTFEPGLDASPDADEGAVQIQKACRLLDLADRIDDLGPYYGAILEHSFIAIEHTFQGYLLAMTGADAAALRNHDTPYEYAKGRVPLETATIDTLKTLYDTRRTSHYYGTTVTTETQATAMRDAAHLIHHHIVSFDPTTERFCRCES